MSSPRAVVSAVLAWVAVVAVGSALVWAVISRTGEGLAPTAVPAPAPTSAATQRPAPRPSATPRPTARPTPTPAPTPSASAPTSPSPPSALAPPAAERGTWQGPGGFVTAECRGAAISLLAVSPDSGYAVDERSATPTEVRVRFEGRGEDSTAVLVRARCDQGVPAFDAVSSGGE